MTRVVVDASFALKWVMEEADSSRAEAILRGWHRRSVGRVAPAWFACEIANALYRRTIRLDVTLSQAQIGLEAIMEHVDVSAFDARLAVRAIELAARFDQRAAYDAHYLALAEHLRCELWTADERLWNATRATLPWVRWLGEAAIRD